MRIWNKRTAIGSTVGAVVSVLSGIYLSPALGVITGLLLSGIGLLAANLNYLTEVRNDVDQRLTSLEIELVTIKNALAREPPFPFDVKYLQLQVRNCPLFKRAALRLYRKATAELDTLAEYQLFVSDLEEVFHWLEILFCEIPMIKSIKAISCGEFEEWQESGNWWMQNYLRLHKIAHERGAEIDRIFIVKSHEHAAEVEKVFKSNLKYHIKVKIGLEAMIQRTDMQCSNCILFFNEQQEAVYALVAEHNHEGDFRSAVIYGDPEAVKGVVASYSRINRVSEPYYPNRYQKLLPRKTA